MQINSIVQSLAHLEILSFYRARYINTWLSDLYTMRLDYNGIVNRRRGVYRWWCVNHRIHIGYLRRLHMHHFRCCVLNGGRVYQWFLIEYRGDRLLVLLKEDLRHRVVIYGTLVRGRVVQRLLIDRRVGQHRTLIDGCHGLDVLQRLMPRRVIVYCGRRRLHVRDGRFRHHSGRIGVLLLNILQVG